MHTAILVPCRERAAADNVTHQETGGRCQSDPISQRVRARVRVQPNTHSSVHSLLRLWKNKDSLHSPPFLQHIPAAARDVSHFFKNLRANGE